MATTARAVLEIVTDASGVDPGLNKVRGSIAGLNADLKGMAGTMGLAFGGAAVVSGIKTLVSNTFAYAENIKDLSAKMAVSTTAAQQWKFAADQSGSSIETVGKAVTKLSTELDGGGKGVRASLKAAGLEFDAIRQMKPEDAFNATVAAVAKIEDPMTQARVATELFGKAGAELLPAIRNGFAETAASANTMSAETIKALDDAKDTWERFGNNIPIISGKALAGIVTTVSDAWQGLEYIALAATQGTDAMYAYARSNQEAKRATEQMGAAQDEAAKKGAAAAAEARAAASAADELAAKQKAAAAAAQRLAEAHQKNVDVWTGKALAREVATLAREVADAGKQGGLSAYQYAELGKKLDDMKAKGATLPPALHNIWLAHEQLNPSIKVTSTNYKELLTLGQQIGTLKPPPPLPLPVSVGPFDFSKLGQQVGALKDAPEYVSLGKQLGNAAQTGFQQGMANMGGVIVGALQGGGNVAEAAGASLGASIGDHLGKAIQERVKGSLGQLLGGLAGPLGAIGGQLLGSLIGKIGGLFGGNDTKKDRESAAKMLGFSSLAAMNDALFKAGEEGARLADIGLNKIGKKDKAANAQWIQDVQDLFAKQGQAAADAATEVEDAATREIEATKRVVEAIQDKIDTLDQEAASVLGSIQDELDNPEYDEFGNRLYDMEEQAAFARLEAIEKQKDDLQKQLADASATVLTEAEVVKVGIEAIFKDPIKVLFDVSQWPSTPGGMTPGPRFGGAFAEGGMAHVTRPTWLLAGERPGGEDIAFSGVGRSFQLNTDRPIVLNATIVSKLNNRVVAQEQIQVQAEAIRRAGG